jgi:putative oxidoreductase
MDDKSLTAADVGFVPKARWLPAVVRIHAAAFRIAGHSAWPVFDLLLRVWLAQAFLMSGVVGMMRMGSSDAFVPHGPLAQWMTPLLHSMSGLSFELVCAVLLAAGLFTQLTSFALLLAALAGAAMHTSDAELFVCALIAGYVVRGAGPFSVDHALGGLAHSALTAARLALRAVGWIRGAILPVYELLLRGWLAAALFLAYVGVNAGPSFIPKLAQAHVVPFASAPLILMSVVGAVLLLTGTVTRYVALLLLLSVTIVTMWWPSSSAEFYWILALGLIALRGPGRWSVDAAIERRLRRAYPELEGKPAFSSEGLPRVVIVGAGFGGLTCAAALRHTRVDVTLIDRANHHLFQPLLYQVATASLSPGDIAAPIRPLFREAFNIRVLFGAVTGVDARAQLVELGENRIPYDYLVLASGATHGYFGKDQWQGLAPGLKRLEDATEIRRRLLTAFERAEVTEDPAERAALLTFLVVGGGPTGVELAGAIAELARLGMQKDFRRFDPASTRIVLVQSAPRILPSFPEALSAIAQRSLEQLGVEVHTGRRVDAIDETGVSVSGEHIPARTVLWAAGVVASPAARWLGVPADPAGRVIVAPDLTVPGANNIFAVGDTAASKGWGGRDVPGLAPAAKQAGAYVARTIAARVAGRPTPPPFRYHHRGNLATIGRKSAVVNFGDLRLWGAPAWWLWGMVHVGLLVGARNRVATVVNWFWSYVTFRSAIRLITGVDSAPRQLLTITQRPPSGEAEWARDSR